MRKRFNPNAVIFFLLLTYFCFQITQAKENNLSYQTKQKEKKITSASVEVVTQTENPIMKPKKSITKEVSPATPKTTKPKKNTPNPQELAAQKCAKQNIKKNVQDISGAIANQADFSFTYIKNQIYKIYCKEGRITDIQLQPGEELLSIVGGDTARWLIDKDCTTGNQKQWHVYIKPLKSQIDTNFIINTDKHTYHLLAYARTWYTPVINWVYPQEEKAIMLKRKKETIPLNQPNPTGLNFAYRIKKPAFRKYKWVPEQIFDDGQKTYFKMPESMQSSTAPILFVKEGRELVLVNYRLKNGIYIIDRLFEEAVLKNGKQKITIKRKEKGDRS